MSGIVDLVNSVEGGPWYTVSQVADKVGKSTDTIKRWLKLNQELCNPRHRMPLGDEGKVKVWLYNDKNIKELVEFSKTQHPGRRKNED